MVGLAARAAHAETTGSYSPNLRNPVLEDAVPFLEALLTGVPGNQFLELRTIAKGGASRKRFYLIDNLRGQGIASALPLHLDSKENVYYGVAPRYEKLEAKTGEDRGDAVNLATAIWFDEITKPPPELPPFSWMVETSFNKVQGGYFLTESTSDLERVERLNKRLGAAVGGDNVWNRGRILRLPGFINAKYEDNQRSYLIEFHPERRYTLEELERLLPPLPADKAQDEDVGERSYESPFNPHHGEPLPDDVKERFLDYLKGLGLTRHSDGRYRGPCPFAHENGASDGETALYVSPVSGTWHCFGSSHEGKRNGGIHSFRALGFRVQLPDFVPNPEATRKLWAIKRGRPPEDKQTKEATESNPHRYQGYCDDCWPIHQRRRKAAQKNGAPDRLTGEVKAHHRYLLTNARSRDAENVYMGNHINDLCIAFEPPQLNTTDLEPLVVAYCGEKDRLGEEMPQVRRVRDCGALVRADCEDHGPRAEWSAECRLNYCPNCLPDIARQLDRSHLPDIDPEDGAAYRSVWLIGTYPLPESLPDWTDHLVDLQKQWESALGKIQRRKSSKGIVLWRSLTCYYTLSEAWVHWKVMFREPAPGAADAAVGELCQVMGAEVHNDRRYVHGELATLQLIENSRSHLLGFSPDIDWEEKFEIFAAHLDATKLRHVFQTMGFLWELMQEAAQEKDDPPPPMVCDVPGCDKRLKITVHRDQQGAPKSETTVGNGAYGPSPPGGSRGHRLDMEAADGNHS